MVIIITGASHTGKTVLAQKILERYGYPYLSIDHLKMGLIRSEYTDLTPEDDDRLTDLLWPIVREMIKTAVENEQDLVVEGCYIPFDWRRDFDSWYLRYIRFICLVMTGEYINGHFQDIKAHSCDIESRLDDSFCSASFLKDENRKYLEGFTAAGEQVTVIDNDYLRSIDTLLKNDTGNDIHPDHR